MRRRCLIAVLALACAKVPPAEPPPPTPKSRPLPVPRPVAVAPSTTTHERKASAVYSLEEALHDALSGPLTYVGTGPWTGNQRIKACAYRNERVLVVDVYCTIKEVKAFRVDVFSPARGRVRLYAEGKAPLSTLARRDYFTFTGESEPAPSVRTGLPPVTLSMSFGELVNYDGRRYRAFLPSCYGGVEIYRRQGGCVRGLASRASEWAATNREFLREPPVDWYRLVRELRELALQHGEDPP